jgi:hypothetical protein
MAINYLGKPPKKWIIPVTLGCDRSFTVRKRDALGQLVNWNAQVYIDISINKASPTRVFAVVDGGLATFTIQSTVCDLTKQGTQWRIVMAVNGFETPLAVGTFERHDG